MPDIERCGNCLDSRAGVCNEHLRLSPGFERPARRYEVSGLYGPWFVGYREPGIFYTIAECDVKANAEKIVEALNAYENTTEGRE